MDLSFEIFENPKHLTEKEKHISYDQYKLTTKSAFKLTSVNFNEYTQSLKLFTKEKDSVKQLRKQVKYIQGQGLDKVTAKVGGEAFTQVQLVLVND